MNHKRQHYVPRSYLQAWCDPDHPPEHTPYIWMFSRDGGRVRKKAPENIFHETDMYTVWTDDGQRDLTIETNLQRVEDKFSKLRREKLNERLPLSPEERLYLCMFVAAMYGRTKAYAEHLSNTFNKALEMGEKVQQAMARGSEEQRTSLRRALSTPQPDENRGFEMEEVRTFVEQPLQEWLPSIVSAVSPLLFKIPFVILEASAAPGFISSDAPCVWFDPADHQTPTPRGAGGLMSPTIEITLPLSPSQMLLFANDLLVSEDYLPVPYESWVNQMNRRTRLHAHEYFVSSRGKLRAAWFLR